MADYDIKLNTNQLIDVLSENDAIRGLLVSFRQACVIYIFLVKERAARTGRNPATGAPLNIPTSKQLVLKLDLTIIPVRKVSIRIAYQGIALRSLNHPQILIF